MDKVEKAILERLPVAESFKPYHSIRERKYVYYRIYKDISFSNQDEFRFIGLDELIEKSVFYPFSFTSQYLITSIEKLKQPLKIKF